MLLPGTRPSTAASAALEGACAEPRGTARLSLAMDFVAQNARICMNAFPDQH
jgi:hypothetical protein